MEFFVNTSHKLHSVEISEIIYHSDFTWNQFLSYNNRHFDIFEALKLDFVDFLQFLRDEICLKTIFRAFEIAKMAAFKLQELSELISRKIWLAEKI